MSDFLGELAEMFPSWDAEALRAVHEANNGDQEKTLTQLLAWTAEDTPSAPSSSAPRPSGTAPQPVAAFPVVCPPNAGPGTQLLVHSPTTGQQMTVVVPAGIGPGLQFLVALPPQFACATPVTSQPAPPRIHDAAPLVLERAFYDDIMSKRITDKMAPKATAALLKATVKLKALAHKAKAEVARRPHVRRLPSSQDAQAIHNATREDKIAAGKALLGQRLSFLALRMVEMADDGNCQFRAVSHELYGTQDHHLRVRAGAVAYLRAHEADFAPFVGTSADFEAYLRRMTQSKQWGDELTLQGACGAFSVDMHVITTETEHFHLEYACPVAGANKPRKLFLSYISPIHYNVVVPNK